MAAQNFVISYVDRDRPWAEWIAWVLEENGDTAIPQVWGDRSGDNIINNPQRAAELDGIILVLSQRYLESATSQRKWQESLTASPIREKLLPIQVEACQPTQLLVSIGLIDLADQSEAEAEQTTLKALQEHRKQNHEAAQVASGDRLVATVGYEAALGEEELLESNESYSGRLKLRRRLETVQYFVEQLNEDLGIEMMLIPGGTFLIGSPEDERERLRNEGPQHEVTVPQFFMGKYPVTQAQWRTVAAMPQVNQKLNLDPSNFKGDNRPVERVSWDDAVEFCVRLSAHTGRDYRLPTEAEWEYACRAGTTTPFHFGETITTELANYHGNYTYGPGAKGEYREETTPVDHFKIANAFGLSDMHGNVLEWCLDHWHDNYEDAPTDGSVWFSSNEIEKRRILRGGSWSYYPEDCRSAFRFGFYPDGMYTYFGFRVVCAVPRTL